MHMNNNKTALVPRLRFPKCAINGAINFETGGVIFEPISNKNHNSDLPVLAITQEHGAIPRDQIDYNVSVTDKSLESYKVVEIGDFIISLRSFQGGIEYSLYHGICSPAYIILRKRVPIVEQYYKYYFKTGRFIQDLNKDIEGIRDGKMVSYSQFSAIILPKPDRKEQQKIADCLSSLDDLITAEDKKLEALRVHKKGLMQKIFSRDLRFKDENGEEFPTWEEKKLIHVATNGIKNGAFNKPASVGRGNPLINVVNLYTEPYIDDSELALLEVSSKELETYQVHKEDIFFTRSSLKAEGIAHCNIYLGDRNDLIFECHIMKITPNKEYTIPLFLKYYFDSPAARQEFMLRAKTTTMTTIGQDDIAEVPVLIPDKKEQQKISVCFSSLDNLIAAQTEKIKALKLHKKGLMQGLFPSIEEVGE